MHAEVEDHAKFIVAGIASAYLAPVMKINPFPAGFVVAAQPVKASKPPVGTDWVLFIAAREVKRQRINDLRVGEIAAEAGVCTRTVQNVVGQGHVAREERPSGPQAPLERPVHRVHRVADLDQAQPDRVQGLHRYKDQYGVNWQASAGESVRPSAPLEPPIKGAPMHRQWGLLLLSLISAGAAMPALGQETAPAVKAGAAAPGGAIVPDFSGFWAHPYNPGLEPPASGPGPVRRVATRGRLIGDYTNPILKPQAAAAVKKHNDVEMGGEAAPIPSNQCWPSGVPYIFFQSGMQMLQQPGNVHFLYLRDHEVRHVRMNEPHPAKLTPSWYGDSVGHYEGDALVIDTVGVKTDRPFAMVDMFGTPFSPALHVVERYRLVDYQVAKEALDRAVGHNVRIPEVGVDDNYRGKYLQLQLTIEDDGVFTTPWSASITYGRLSTPWEEHACSENPHEYYPNGDPKVPVAGKPDF